MGEPEVGDLADEPAAARRLKDEDVERLEVAVDDGARQMRVQREHAARHVVQQRNAQRHDGRARLA